MHHLTSASDDTFRIQFEAGQILPGQFDHRAHIRLAYVYLVASSTEDAYSAMRTALRSFLDHHKIDASKYHDTLTRAWTMAVRHFMEKTPACQFADELIERNPQMLDPSIMLTHYSAGALFSAEARSGFVEPDIQSIPNYDDAN